MIQDTIDDSEKILQRIKYELGEAEQEILVAMAWFTNAELFSIIAAKLDDNVKISIILSEHADNEKLDFDHLIAKGAQLERIKNIGWGMMHQKFCIIDRKIAITGSYNWSNNAKNNHEHVIVTDFPKTVNELVDTFMKIQKRSHQLNNGYTLEELKKDGALSESGTESKTVEIAQPVNFQQKSFNDFRDVLDNIIATEIGSFDKELLKSNAYTRAIENNGDHQVLPQAMDSLYSNFINEIEVIGEKKNRLNNKITEQLKISISNVELKTENEINNLNENLLLETKHLEQDIAATEKHLNEKNAILQSITDIKIPFIENKIAAIRQKNSELKLDFVKPPVNWPMTFLLCFLTVILFFYIFVFYSSVAYIFMFSKEDAIIQVATGVITETAEVFNAHAITKIWDKGAGGIMFLFLFVIIPVALGLVDLIVHEPTESANSKSHNKFTKGLHKLWSLGGILVIDAFMAFKVSKNINEVEYLTNKTDKQLEALDVMGTESFWLVFILGSLGVFLFGLVAKALFKRFNKRNTTFQQEKIKFLVQQNEQETENLETAIQTFKEERHHLLGDITLLEKDKENFTAALNAVPLTTGSRINFLQQQLLSFKEKVENIAQIYRSQVENDRLPLSKAEMENRVNIFMEGWSKYLYDRYAINVAEKKTTEAIHQCETWLENLSIKTNSSPSLTEIKSA